jgi:hypothetical protein
LRLHAPDAAAPATVTALLDHPAVQGGAAPLVVALFAAAIFARTRASWIAILAAYATRRWSRSRQGLRSRR